MVIGPGRLSRRALIRSVDAADARLGFGAAAAAGDRFDLGLGQLHDVTLFHWIFLPVRQIGGITNTLL